MLRAVIWCAVSTKEQTADDKHSLPEQEADAKALCDREGWRIVDVLIVPGHSRRYVDFHELAAHARREGIPAFDKMWDYWQGCAFDVLIVRDGDRFARTQALHALFVEMTIDSGARVYSLADGFVDANNYRMWISMNGYHSASHVDGLVKARAKGMRARMDRGLNGGSTIPMCYRVARDERGKATRLEFRPEYRRLMDDAAQLLLDGVGWKAFSLELYRRYGHVNSKTGKPYHDNTFYRLFHNPLAWGVTAMRFAGNYGLWAFDDKAPLPEGVILNRKPEPAIPPVWEGETAELVKAELHRRAALIHGRATANSEYALTGLLMCATCQRRMASDSKKMWKSEERYLYWRCSSHTYRHYRLGAVCDNRKLIRDDTAQEQIAAFLSRYLAQNAPDLTPFLQGESESYRQQTRAEQLRGEIAALRLQIDRLITSQSQAPNNIYEQYTRQIEQASGKLALLEGDLQRTEAVLEPPIVTMGREMAYTDLSQRGLQAFWGQAPREINQAMHRIMGKHRFAVQDGEIIGIRERIG